MDLMLLAVQKRTICHLWSLILQSPEARRVLRRVIHAGTRWARRERLYAMTVGSLMLLSLVGF